jgi:hypothetical protein
MKATNMQPILHTRLIDPPTPPAPSNTVPELPAIAEILKAADNYGPDAASLVRQVVAVVAADQARMVSHSKRQRPYGGLTPEDLQAAVWRS